MLIRRRIRLELQGVVNAIESYKVPRYLGR